MDTITDDTTDDTTTEDPLRAVEQITATTDPLARAEQIVAAFNLYGGRLYAARKLRDQAVISAAVDDEILPAKIWRPAGISRSLFNRLLARAPAVRRWRIEDDPVTVAVEANREAEALTPVVARLAEIREETAAELLGSMTNADVARLLRVSSVRTSQIRRGTA